VRRSVIAGAAFAVWLAAGGTGGAAEEHAHVARIGPIEVVHAWSRASSAGDGVLFMELANEGDEDDLLIGARSDIAERIELHGARLRDGETVSEPVGSMPLPAGSELVLEPEVLFFKIFGLERALIEGGSFDVELRFENAGSGPVEVAIEAADAMQHGHAGHGH